MAEPSGSADALARLAALRASGADAVDPVRFAYLESLARRLADHPETIRGALSARIAAAAEELDTHPRPAAAAEKPASADAASPLAGLLAYLGQIAGTLREAPAPATLPRRQSASGKAGIGAPAAPELKSVTYFRKTWSKLSTEQQLTQTLAQAPENAGPMNSQHLVLRSLQFMRDISPAYLQGFMSYIDALIWLDEASPVKAAAARSPAGGAAAKGVEGRPGEAKGKRKGKPPPGGR